MRQCPDCEAKDRVMIAGKVFCANCGTPWQPADQKEYDQYVASLTPPTPGQAPPAATDTTQPAPPNQPAQAAPANPTPAPAPSAAAPADDSAAVAALSASVPAANPPDQAVAEKPAAPAAPAPSPVPTTPPPTPAPPKTPVVPINIGSPLDSAAPAAPATSSVPTPPPSAPAPAASAAKPTISPPAVPPAATSININAKSTAERIASAADIGKSTSINKFHQPPKTDSPSAVAPSSPAPAGNNAAPAPNQSTSVNLTSAAPATDKSTSAPPADVKDAPASPDQAKAKQDLSEHVGAEISDIESKDDGVLSDSQFKELNKINEEQPETAPPSDDLDTAKPIASQSASAAAQALVATPSSKDSDSLPTPPPAPAAQPKVSSQSPVEPAAPAVKPTPSTAPATVRSMTDVAPAPKISTNSPLNKLAEQPITPITQMPSASQSKPASVGSAFRPARPATVSVAPAAAPAQAAPAQAGQGETTTVAGLTMSKEAALKLALDADTNKNTGEAAIGKAFKPSSVALSLVGLLLIGAYIWQVNYPNLALKVAGNRAGLAINLPSYLPNDWKLSGPIQSQPGSVSYNLANDKKDHQVAVTAAKTDWDSQALADNYVATKSDSYLALQSQGLTVYVYGDNQASWVNDGKWYRLEGSSSGLSQDQLIKMATSL